ncbi:MAG: hypothetical protein WBL80_06645 [Erysipelotrichaceae bacterium]
MNRLKQSIEQSFLDEDRVLRNIERDIAKRRLLPNRTVLSMAAATVILALLIGTVNLLVPTNVIAGVLTVDLNPSLRIELSKDYKVMKATAQNAQAETMDLRILKGMKIQDALKEFVRQSVKDGYIDTLKLTEDYLLVTTISLNGKDETFNINLKEILAQLQKEQSLLSDVQLAVMNAKEQDLREADASDTPLWLYVLSGKNPDTLTSATSNVQGYFEDSALKTKFETEYGQVLEDQHKVSTEDIQEALDELSEAGVDVTAYRARLSQAGVDLDKLKNELLILLEKVDEEESSETNQNEVEEHEEKNEIGKKEDSEAHSDDD